MYLDTDYNISFYKLLILSIGKPGVVGFMLYFICIIQVLSLFDVVRGTINFFTIFLQKR